MGRPGWEQGAMAAGVEGCPRRGGARTRLPEAGVEGWRHLVEGHRTAGHPTAAALALVAVAFLLLGETSDHQAPAHLSIHWENNSD